MCKPHSSSVYSSLANAMAAIPSPENILDLTQQVLSDTSRPLLLPIEAVFGTVTPTVMLGIPSTQKDHVSAVPSLTAVQVNVHDHILNENVQAIDSADSCGSNESDFSNDSEEQFQTDGMAHNLMSGQVSFEAVPVS